MESTAGKQLLSVDEVAALLDCSERTVWSWAARKDDFPQPLRRGKWVRWRRRDVERWLEGLRE